MKEKINGKGKINSAKHTHRWTLGMHFSSKRPLSPFYIVGGHILSVQLKTQLPTLLSPEYLHTTYLWKCFKVIEHVLWSRAYFWSYAALWIWTTKHAQPFGQSPQPNAHHFYTTLRAQFSTEGSFECREAKERMHSIYSTGHLEVSLISQASIPHERLYMSTKALFSIHLRK